ncbi:MAG TPA: hypothetical protein VLS48_02190 [Anaerolineales bacterium]|nr:hypothetical protein [Anaerolineales bacterium]
MKKLYILLVLVATLALMAAAPLAERLTRFEVINKTSEDVIIKLESSDFYYYLTIGADDDATFTVERDVYDATVWSCGNRETAEIDLLTQLRLVFPDCTSLPEYVPDLAAYAAAGYWIVGTEVREIVQIVNGVVYYVVVDGPHPIQGETSQEKVVLETWPDEDSYPNIRVFRFQY